MIFLEKALQKRKKEGTLRTLSISKGIDLTSNDYFGFAKSLFSTNYQGATGSRLLTGNHPFFEKLEEKIAHFHGTESALIYNTGYMANLGLIAALGREKTTFLYDIEIHASLIDGMRLSKAKSFPFRHNDLNCLERRLKKASNQVFVLVESLYSLSGTFAPLKEIAILCTHYGAALIVDEAHATGFSGPFGRGYLAEQGVKPFAQIHTFSKALGSHGACVLGSKILKAYLLNFSRPLIYTTALPQSCLYRIESAYDKLQKEAESHQRHLKELIHYFQKKSGLYHSKSPIQPIYGKDVLHLSKKLRENNLDVRAILPPSTKQECLRVVLHSFNREEHIDKLLEVLQ